MKAMRFVPALIMAAFMLLIAALGWPVMSQERTGLLCAQIGYDNCVEAWSGSDITLYSDAGASQVLNLDGATGNVTSAGDLAVDGVAVTGDADFGGDVSADSLAVASGAVITGTVQIGDVAGGNYAEIESDGTLAFYGDATVFDDIRVPVSATKAGGTKDPDFAVWKTDGAGSQGVFVEWFDKSTEEELYFNMQMPHSWKTGTDIEPHVHWIPAADGSAGAVVNWALECNWTAIGSVGITTTIIYSSTNHAGDTTLTADKHYLTELGTLDGSSISGVSSMAVCRVFRDATGGLATDDYDDDAGLLEIDFHYEIDTIGSRSEYVK